ncbi:ROK family transcriptional regulator, partial [Cellulomonas triticagri]
MLDPATADLPPAARAVLREVLVHGPVERADVGRRLGLSPASLTRLTRPLLDAGLLVEGAGVARTGAGRPARPLDVQPGARKFAGVKITGDDVTAVLTDLRAEVLASAHAPLRDRGVAEVVEQVAVLVRGLSADAGATLAGVGVSVGGRVRDRDVAVDAPFLGWTEVPLATALHQALGVPVRAENDVVALLVAEQWAGPARDLDTFALVTVGAGVGYGLVVHGRPVTGPDAAPLAHAPLLPDGPPCPDGHRGCATAVLTTGGLRAQVRDADGYAAVLAAATAGDT